ncbi:MAG TPA: 16S rRNA (adenine(1518)-N(6)/adenine(1519)-N(6))-dimethyltransferase RsmA [Anaerolineae bacterium]|jgi:16S rRNA (adenine1518-N6/adenine1519-N6)-dimethyltransferase
MSSSTNIKHKLNSFGLTPRKSLGQNFLTDDDTARRIVRLANIKPDDIVIEIGPGIGALTKHLAQSAHKVIAIEIDQNLIPILQQELAEAPNVTILHADALDVDFTEAVRDVGGDQNSTVRVVGNLPYYITSLIVRRVLESAIHTQAIVLTVQLEVAERMVAQPDDMSMLAVSVQVYGKPELLMRLSPSAFYPQPDVDSAVVRIIPHRQVENPQALFDLARAGFSQKRKQLRNTLAAGLRLEKPAVDELLTAAAIDSTRRAETLSIPEWSHLAQVYLAHGYAAVNRSERRTRDSDSIPVEAAPSAANSTV